jgi:hypothetical protein
MNGMNPIIRSVLSILAGIIVVPVIVMFIERVSSELYPMGPVDWEDKEAVARAVAEHIKTMPAGGFLMVLLAWQTAAFGGGALAAWIAGRLEVLHATAIGCFVVLATLANVLMLPGHPGWMVAAGLILPIPVAMLAGKVMSLLRRKGPQPLPAKAVKK